jgi:hypothetical protein
MDLLAAEVARTTEAHEFLTKVLAPEARSAVTAPGPLSRPR